MTESAAAEGRIITFYSYKGGTGRSMAMANVSFLLALSGLKVLVIDWDLEAPGLHRYFRPFLDDSDLAESDGLIDFVIHFAEAASEQTEEADVDWYKTYSNLLPYAKELNYDFPGQGTLDFIAAGRQNSSYAVRVNSFNWKHFFEKLNGGKVLEEARRILKEEYDYILIDSRTGVSDTAGICTVEMPDDLVVCFTLNLQSVLGASAAAASVMEQRAHKGKPIRVFPVPTRVEPNEKIKTATMKAYAKPRFVPLLPPDMTDEQQDKYWAESDVPYIPFYAFEENLAYFRDEPNSLNSVLTAMTRIAARLAPIDILNLPRLDARVQAETVAAYDAFSGKAAPTAGSPSQKLPAYVSGNAEWNSFLLLGNADTSGFEMLTRERFEKARSAVFLMPVGAGGVSPSQQADLALAERLSIGPIFAVLLPGAHPETLPRLLLPYPFIELPVNGSLALPDPANLQYLPVAPYPGLDPFTDSDGPFFVARGSLTASLAEAVTRSNFVALVGPPHSGRTSLVRGGLIPLLKAGEAQGRAWDVRFTWPGDIKSTARMLVVMSAKDLAATANSKICENTCVLVIAETTEQLESCEQRMGGKAERIDVPPLTAAELTAAVNEPAARAGLRVEPGLAPRIVADVKDEKAQLPLLQYLLSELYAAEPRGDLTLQKYERMGGPQMVERKCESVFTGSGFGSLSRLVFVADGGTLSAQNAAEASLGTADRAALDAFVTAGVVVRESDSLRFSSRIFLDRWPRLRRWVEDNREFLVWRQRLDQSLAAWQTNPRAYTLLSGDALAEAQRQVETHRGDLNDFEISYISASAKNAQTDVVQPAASRQPKGRSYFWIAALVTVAIIGIAIFPYVGLKPPKSASKVPSDVAPVKEYPAPQPAKTAYPATAQDFPDRGWCYQETASTATAKLGLVQGYGAYCHLTEEHCKLASSRARTASQCVYALNLNLQTWGGVKPTAGGYKGSWFRHNLPEPLASPFPQPPVEYPPLRR